MCAFFLGSLWFSTKSQNDSQMVNTQMKTCSQTLAVREVQVKTTKKYCYISIKICKIKKKNPKTTKYSWRCRTTGEHVKW